MPHQRPSNHEELLRQAERLIKSPAYYSSDHSDHKQVHRVVRSIYQKVYGSEDEGQHKLPPSFYKGSTDNG